MFQYVLNKARQKGIKVGYMTQTPDPVEIYKDMMFYIRIGSTELKMYETIIDSSGNEVIVTRIEMYCEHCHYHIRTFNKSKRPGFLTWETFTFEESRKALKHFRKMMKQVAREEMAIKNAKSYSDIVTMLEDMGKGA